jgi:polar amino acid transport system substrate-binding protein
MVTAGLYKRPQRCAAVNFTEPDLCDFEAFAVKTGNPTGIMTYADLGASDTVKVGAPGGGTEEKLALDSGVPRDRVIVVPDTQSGIKMLQDGRIDVYALPYLSLADAIEKSGGGLELVGPVENTPIFCAGAAFPKDATALRDAYNVVLAELKASGEFAKIIEPFGFKAEPAMMVTTEELCNRPTE